MIRNGALSFGLRNWGELTAAWSLSLPLEARNSIEVTAPISNLTFGLSASLQIHLKKRRMIKDGRDRCVEKNNSIKERNLSRWLNYTSKFNFLSRLLMKILYLKLYCIWHNQTFFLYFYIENKIFLMLEIEDNTVFLTINIIYITTKNPKI